MKRESNVHEGFLSGAGFFGAVSITALVLVLSFPSTFQVNGWYFSSLLSLLAIASSSSVIATFSSIVVWGRESYGEEFREGIRKFTVCNSGNFHVCLVDSHTDDPSSGFVFRHDRRCSL